MLEKLKKVEKLMKVHQTVWPDWAKFCHLGYFLLNQFSPKQAVSTHGLFEGFNGGLMWMFLAFKLSFDGDILVFLPTLPKIRQNFIQFSGHTSTNQPTNQTKLHLVHFLSTKVSRTVFMVTAIMTFFSFSITFILLVQIFQNLTVWNVAEKIWNLWKRKCAISKFSSIWWKTHLIMSFIVKFNKSHKTILV